MEPGFIVGIASGDLSRRVLDYTPPVGNYAIPKGAPTRGLAIDGCDACMSFFDEQLAPQVARQVPIDCNRQSLAGHSFGRLLALHALFGGNNIPEAGLADAARLPPVAARLGKSNIVSRQRYWCCLTRSRRDDAYA